ncbi:MAG: D-2-hydroxyacid dehydrogenase [Lysobacterales bacterium]|jgi:phosphoglycerate dehydrogenase-like enzyme
MQLPGVLVLAPDAEDYLPLLGDLVRRGAEVSVATDPGSALDAGSRCEVLLAQPDLAAEALPRLPAVRWVQSTWAGVEPLLARGPGNYRLTSVKGVFGPMMAEYVFGYILGHELRQSARLEHQKSREWWPVDSGSLSGKTLGVMGTGSIGRHIAHTGRAFGMRVIGYSRRGEAVEPFDPVFPAEQLRDFLSEPDYLVAVLPGTPDTDGLLDAGAFRAMKPSCLLVNVGRGSLVDEHALVDGLRQGELAGAVLDVFRQEPLPESSPLWDTPGVTVTAHVAARSRPADVARVFLANYNRYVAGLELEHLVDFEQGY